MGALESKAWGKQAREMKVLGIPAQLPKVGGAEVPASHHSRGGRASTVAHILVVCRAQGAHKGLIGHLVALKLTIQAQNAIHLVMVLKARLGLAAKDLNSHAQRAKTLQAAPRPGPLPAHLGRHNALRAPKK
ncbi:MAG: hypothetical protein EBZ60_08470 [Betaproteobacteria bacterium]|nr:hypothetical protein [Betaproteobacteria bacterium]